jgi:hemolysin III
MEQAQRSRWEKPAHMQAERDYSRAEIVSDSVVHAVGLAGALIGGALLIWHTALWRSGTETGAVSIYALALVLMLSCSLTYNAWPDRPFKWLMRRFDHCGIYLLIAGTYTPLLTQVSDPFTAYALGVTVWGGAIGGVILALGFPLRTERFRVVIYLALAWVAVLAMRPLTESLSAVTLTLMIAGGLLYTGGVVFYRWNSLKFQNTIWHVFVVLAATCHFAAIAAAMARP